MNRKTNNEVPVMYSQEQIDQAIESNRDKITEDFEHNVSLVFKANGLDYFSEEVKSGITKLKNKEGVVTMFHNEVPICSYSDGVFVEVAGSDIYVSIKFTSLIHIKITTKISA